METKGFSVGEALKFGWGTMKSHLGFFIGVILLTIILPLIPYGIAMAAGPVQSMLVMFLVVLASVIISLTVQLGVLKIALAFAKGEQGRFRDLFSCIPMIWNYFLGSLLYTVIVVIGFVLLVFPGVIWGMRYMLFPYFIVERGVGPLEALQLSAKTTHGGKWDLFAFLICAWVIAMIGTLALFIGLFAAVPVIWVAQAFVYRRLLLQSGA